MTPSVLPNSLTIARILLTGPLVWLLMNERYAGALIVALLAGVSDGADGYLAKRYGGVSRLGGVLDPIADKLMLIASYVSLGVLHVIPGWLVTAVIVRDVVIVVGATIYHFLFAPIEPQPSWLSKWNTVFQIGLVLVMLVQEVWPVFPALTLQIFFYAVFALTVASGAHYMYIWGLKAWRVSHRG